MPDITAIVFMEHQLVNGIFILINFGIMPLIGRAESDLPLADADHDIGTVLARTECDRINRRVRHLQRVVRIIPF